MHRRYVLGLLMLWTGAVLIGAGWSMAPSSVASAWNNAAGPNPGSVMRLHILANSDSDADQSLKRAVRDAVLAEVSPLFASAGTLAEVQRLLGEMIPNIEQIAAGVISRNGQSMAVRAELGRYAFPGKAYGALYLPAGEYTALRILIGDAEGANWWCVLWPPLCFVDWTTGIVRESEGPGGIRTVAVPKKKVLMLEEEELERAKVKPRLAVVRWVKSKFR